LDGTSARLRTIADTYDAMATEASLLSQRIGNCVAHAVDLALALLATSEAAVAASPTVVGGGLLSAATTYELYQFYKTLRLGLELGEALVQLTDGFTGKLAQFTAFEDPQAMPTVPAMSALPR
jgi:hypothetical protein